MGNAAEDMGSRKTEPQTAGEEAKMARRLLPPPLRTTLSCTVRWYTCLLGPALPHHHHNYTEMLWDQVKKTHSQMIGDCNNLVGQG